MPDSTGPNPIAHAAKDSMGHWRPPHDLDEHFIRQVSGFEADAHIKGGAGKAPHSTANVPNHPTDPRDAALL
ncbi:MAG: hypothetical protein KGL51_06260 [Betaproteobacteria bacterium]|nr:hypothetical protein [Betaproteobacteria bacterium]MDE2185868.1 hypothetical protein [Betaproteobacteria bacterium]MDE2324263.1 hypothetical protein [Betaproteobacteria bacterium]